MKKAIFLITLSILFFISCIPNPEEDEDTVVPVGNLKVDFDGGTFVSNTTQVILNEDLLSITALGSSNNAPFFQITLPEAPQVRTYTWSYFNPTSSGFALLYRTGTSAESVSYLAARDDSGEFANFPEYTDTAELVITNIDRVNKRISGTFKFTGVRLAGLNDIATKVFTNGSFTSLPYKADVVSTGNNSFFAKLNGVDFVPTNINGILASDRISIIGRKGNIQNISLSLIKTITPGTYDLDIFGDYVGQFVLDSTPQGSSFGAESGTVTITSHDPVTKNIKGTFKYLATSLLVPNVEYNITDGIFDVTYQ